MFVGFVDILGFGFCEVCVGLFLDRLVFFVIGSFWVVLDLCCLGLCVFKDLFFCLFVVRFLFWWLDLCCVLV